MELSSSIPIPDKLQYVRCTVWEFCSTDINVTGDQTSNEDENGSSTEEFSQRKCRT